MPRVPVRRPLAFLALALALVLALPASAQRFTPAGGAYVDYAVRLAPDSAVGDQGFVLRRAWASATVQQRRTMARLRLETDAGTAPNVRVYEAYVRLDSLAGAHRLAVGLLQMYGIQRSETMWAHRFLARTIVAERARLSSRDLGVQLDGPAGPLHYALALTSGRGVKARLGDEAYLSAALATSGDAGVQVLGTLDHAWQTGGPGTVAGLALSSGPRTMRMGAEAFVQRGDAGDREGVGVFAFRRVSDRWRLVGRLDATRTDGFDDLAFDGLVAAVYRHDTMLEIAPALVLVRDNGGDTQVTARLTASLRF